MAGIAVTHSVFDAPSSVILSLKNSSRAEKFEWLMPSAEISQTLKKKPSMFFIEPKGFSDNNWGLAKLGSLERAKADWDTVPLCLMQGPKFSSSAPVVFELPRMHLERSKLPLNVPRAPSVPRDISAPLRAPGSVQVEYPNAPPPQLATTLKEGPIVASLEKKSRHILNMARPHKLYPDIICESGRMYMPTSKHMPIPGNSGKALWGKDASINPIPDYKTGQALLDKALPVSVGGDSLVYLYTKPNETKSTIIIFRPSKFNNEWHAHQLKKDIASKIGGEVLQVFVDNKLLAKSHRKKLLGQ